MTTFTIRDIARFYAPRVDRSTEDVLPFIREAIEAIAEFMTDKMQQGDKLRLRSLGTFEVRRFAGRPGTFKHWRTKELIQRPGPGSRLHFKPTRPLVKQISKKQEPEQ